MNTRNPLVFGLVAAIGIAIASMVAANRKAETMVAKEQGIQPTAIEVAEPSQTLSPPEISVMETVVSAQKESAPVAPAARTQVVAVRAIPPANAKELQDPDARAALSLVGNDPVAEEYWMAAIFDPSLPDKERADLMEDLNEEGLSDPKHPGPEDMPLIVNRIRLIEAVAPQADEFMLPRLVEAYKDLHNLLAGKEVR